MLRFDVWKKCPFTPCYPDFILYKSFSLWLNISTFSFLSLLFSVLILIWSCTLKKISYWSLFFLYFYFLLCRLSVSFNSPPHSFFFSRFPLCSDDFIIYLSCYFPSCPPLLGISVAPQFSSSLPLFSISQLFSPLLFLPEGLEALHSYPCNGPNPLSLVM